MNKIFQHLKNWGKVDDYEAAYNRQLIRNEALVKRITNLQAEIERQKNEYADVIRHLDPTIRGMTREELGRFRTLIIELLVEVRPLLGCENVKYGIGNLAAGYDPAGEYALDTDDDDHKPVYETAKILNQIIIYMDIGDD